MFDYSTEMKNIQLPLAIVALLLVFVYVSAPPKKEPYCASCMMK